MKAVGAVEVADSRMHGFVLANGRSEAVSNHISWLEQRVTKVEFDEIAAQRTGSERNELGNELRPVTALPLLYWLKRRRALPAGEVIPVSIADFVAARLCGKPPAMADSPASGDHQTRPYFDGGFLRTITHIPAGRALSPLIGLLTELGGPPAEDAWRHINLHEGNVGIGTLFELMVLSLAFSGRRTGVRAATEAVSESLLRTSGTPQ